MKNSALSNPEEDTQRNEICNRISTALKSLKRDEREAFLLCKVEELTYKEAAEYMKVSTSTVYRNLRRAKRKLREIFQNSHDR